MVQIKITGELVDQFEEYEVCIDQEESLCRCVELLVDVVPELESRLIHNGKLAPHLVVIFQGKPVIPREFATTFVQLGDEIEIMPIAGGG